MLYLSFSELVLFVQFDLWVERAIPSRLGEAISDIHTVIYVTSQSESTDSFLGSMSIKGQGYYDAETGLLCLLGCVDDEQRKDPSLRKGQTSTPDPFEDPSGASESSSSATDGTSEPADIDDVDEGTTSFDGALTGSQEAVCSVRLLLRFRLTEVRRRGC